MANIKYENVMEILEDESMNELKSAMFTKELMKKTLNPFKRIAYKRSCERFMEHSIAVDRAIRRIKRELES